MAEKQIQNAESIPKEYTTPSSENDGENLPQLVNSNGVDHLESDACMNKSTSSESTRISSEGKEDANTNGEEFTEGKGGEAVKSAANNDDRSDQEGKDPETITMENVPHDEGNSKETDAELDDLDLDPGDLDLAARNRLFERGQKLYEENKNTDALRCFLRCLSGLEGTNGFSYLPQCLRCIADIYYTEDEYEKAVQFIQAEKLYYETALVDSKGQPQAGKPGDTESGSSVDVEGSTDGDNVVLARASEYEELAKLCLQHEQPQLALEYQAKATKMRQQTLGDNDPLTLRSLDFFTEIYGEVGKQQYSESVQKASSEPQDYGEGTGLRQRKGNKTDGNKSSDGELRSSSEAVQEQEEWISQVLLLVLFGMCVVVLIGVLFYLYCKIDTSSRTCSSLKTNLHYYYMRFKYFYYSLTKPSKTYG